MLLQLFRHPSSDPRKERSKSYRGDVPVPDVHRRPMGEGTAQGCTSTPHLAMRRLDARGAYSFQSESQLQENKKLRHAFTRALRQYRPRVSSRFKYAASGAGANVEKKVEKKPIQLAWKVRMCGCEKLQICSSVALCSASTAHLNGRPWRSHLRRDAPSLKNATL